MDPQTLANLLADYFTAAELETLATKMGLQLAQFVGETRQQTADNLVQYLSQINKIPLLYKTMKGMHERLFEENKGLTINLDIELTDEERHQLTGTLRDSDGRQPAPERFVNTGFTDQDNPTNPLSPKLPLQSGRLHYFWLEIGEKLENAIEEQLHQLDVEGLAPEAQLQVVLFSFPGEIALTAGQDVGVLTLTPEQKIIVHTPAARPPHAPAELLKKRLFFPIHTPAEEGSYRLRCHIYYEQILLQSRLITAKVSHDPQPTKNVLALRSVADYLISKSLQASKLTQMPPQKCAIFLNDNGNGTHGLRFFGKKGDELFKNEATFSADELQNLINLARGALRSAAWGKETEYQDGDVYRYGGGLDLQKLRDDLVFCAIRGFRLYDALINRFAGNADQAWELQDLMRRPGIIQIASKASARLVIPAALFYDFPLNTGMKFSEFTLCSHFTQALQAGTPLASTPCFQGDCPHYGDDTIVCPSGFWGFRHTLAQPVTIAGGPDAPTELAYSSAPELAVAVSTDPNFVGRVEHEQALKNLRPDIKWLYADERAETLEMMLKNNPHVLYFFCHGRIASDTPSIEVGPPKTRGIFRDNLRNQRIRWSTTRPVVILNGCHTAALEPDKAIDLVGGFIDVSQAAGVIGTEITNFVPVARLFAEECLNRFLVQGQTIGEAIQGGRLKLLQQGNPLGLMYIAYVMPGLKLVQKPG